VTADSPARQAVGAAPWEGPLVSDTTEVFTGSSGNPEESPALFPAPGTAAGGAQAAGRASAAGSGPDGHAEAGGTAAAGTRRRGGTGVSGMLLPEL
jgi:hypothetical protein